MKAFIQIFTKGLLKMLNFWRKLKISNSGRLSLVTDEFWHKNFFYYFSGVSYEIVYQKNSSYEYEITFYFYYKEIYSKVRLKFLRFCNRTIYNLSTSKKVKSSKTTSDSLKKIPKKYISQIVTKRQLISFSNADRCILWHQILNYTIC
jgi:hypothetical protein